MSGVELKKVKSNVSISVLCPGPVNTNFNNVANVDAKIFTKLLPTKIVVNVLS